MMAVLLLIVFVLGGIHPAEAQQRVKTPRIGLLFIGSKDQPHLDSFHQGLRELSYVDGKNISIEYRYAEGKSDVLRGLASELVALNVDVILTTTPQASRAVLQANSAVPIVAVGFDPVATTLVKSLARPGGNVTGLTNDAGPGMTGKRLELLKGAFPRTKIVAILLNPGGQFLDQTLEHAKTAAEALGLQIRPYYIRGGEDIDRAFDPLKNLRAHALLISGGPLMTLNSRRIIELATKLRLPAMHQTRNLVEDGGLMAYGVHYGDLYRRAAVYVDKVLKGARPADLPVEQPTKFELVINLKTANQIGLTIPPHVLARADKVIK